jgi:hypothetical protein
VPTPQLNEGEKRQVLLQLIELQTLRQKVQMYEDFFAKVDEQNKSAVSTCQRAITIEKEIAAVTGKSKDAEIAMWKEKADFYKQQYDLLQKKGPSFGCIIKKIFTLGIGRC